MGIRLLEYTKGEKVEGPRAIFFKVTNIEKAIEEWQKKGIRLLAFAENGLLKQAMFAEEDLHGARLVLAEYPTKSAIDAVLLKR